MNDNLPPLPEPEAMEHAKKAAEKYGSDWLPVRASGCTYPQCVSPGGAPGPAERRQHEQPLDAALRNHKGQAMTALPPLPTPDTHCFDDDTGTQALWPQMISALAAIDRELGLPDDGCNSTALTLNAIRMMNLAHRDDVKAITSLEGERAVLIGILTDCAAVLQTIEPDNSDEAEKLADLLGAIDRAQAPSRHKGALL